MKLLLGLCLIIAMGVEVGAQQPETRGLQREIPVVEIRYIVTDLDQVASHVWTFRLHGHSFGLIEYQTDTSICYGWGERLIHAGIYTVAGSGLAVLLLIGGLGWLALRRGRAESGA